MNDRVADLEAARCTGDTAYVIFQDMCRVLDSLLHNTILGQLRAYKIVARIYAFIGAFRRDRHSVVRSCGFTISPRNASQEVPQESVMSPLRFNLAKAAIPGATSPDPLLPV